MKILVVGSGAREHALCAKIAESPLADVVFCAPGNPGIDEVPKCSRVEAHTNKGIRDFARYSNIHLVVIGPERPLAEGLADWLREEKIPVCGPNKCAAEIEWSKLFAKRFMDAHGIPTAPWLAATRTWTAQRASQAFAGGPMMHTSGVPIVIKVDGLAQGKGVFIAHTTFELHDALNEIFVAKRFGTAGRVVIVEEKLRGLEVTATCITDGKRVIMLPDSMDYKQAEDGDRGRNTGGMGSHSPSFVLTTEEHEWIRVNIMQKSVDGLRAEGREFRGVLTAGLMVSNERKIDVLEFNARFNDPECQVIMARIDEDIVPFLYGAAIGKFPQGISALKTKQCVVANVVLVSSPYPQEPTIGDEITGVHMAERCTEVSVWHGNTARRTDGKLVTAGGRVLNVCAVGDSLQKAVKKAYQGAALIDWEHKASRSDIGCRVLKIASNKDFSP
ncbi:phosphoribosylamine--glycine ligase [Candidatus Kaiserbacteria bacterium]|nr:phosphoribosylamine--glycine ligase [Candidatus Kaiserbacteria bacterium]